MVSRINLKVLILDTDFYALRAINSYMAWDRRTRVVAQVESIAAAEQYINSVAPIEHPDVLLMEAEACPTAEALAATIRRFRAMVKDLVVVCTAHYAEPERIAAAWQAGARGYVLRNELRLRLVGAILFAMDRQFVVTPAIQAAARPPFDGWLAKSELLPDQREYPEMTERIRQAIWLCVIEGMPAQLAADEMGISPHTIRSYVKEGYRILEAYDDGEYPDDLSPLERAFMRFTALEQRNNTGRDGKSAAGSGDGNNSDADKSSR